MAVSETPRHKFKRYGAGTDAFPTRTTFNGEVDKLEALPAVIQGSSGSRPTAGVGKILYWDESTRRLHLDDGTEWREVSPIGGVAARAVSIGGTGAEGASPRAARGDHVHPMPLATSEAHGALSMEDKALIDTATADATEHALARRGPGGRMAVGAPEVPADAATKKYVDQLLAAGQATANIATANTVTATSVVFPAGKFSKTPIVTVTPLAAPHLLAGPVTAENVSKAGFTLWSSRTAPGPLLVNWVAVAT